MFRSDFTIEKIINLIITVKSEMVIFSRLLWKGHKARGQKEEGEKTAEEKRWVGCLHSDCLSVWVADSRERGGESVESGVTRQTPQTALTFQSCAPLFLPLSTTGPEE